MRKVILCFAAFVFGTGNGIFCKKKEDATIFGIDQTTLAMMWVLTNPKKCITPKTPTVPLTGLGFSVPPSPYRRSLSTPLSAGQTAPIAAASNYVPGEALVQFSSKHIPSAIKRKMKTVPGIKKKGGEAQLHRVTSTLYRIELDETAPVSETVERLKKTAGVSTAQPNYLYRIHQVPPNDANYSLQWGLKNTGQSFTGNLGNMTGTPGIDIAAETAWGLQPTCTGAVVAVLDSGVNYNHEDLATNMWNGSAVTCPNGQPCSRHGYDFVSNDIDPMDENGHGTHVAGIIGGVGNNLVGITGVCQSGVKLMAVRVLDGTGLGTTANLVQGIDFARTSGAHIMNASWGIAMTTPDALLEAAIQRAEQAGILFVAAAGNDGSNNDTTPVYPASYPVANIISVAALDPTGNLASFSNFGATSVDIAAPGVYIDATWPGITVGVVDSFQNGITEWSFSGWPFYWQPETLLYKGMPVAVMSDPSRYGTPYGPFWNATAYRCFNLTGFDSANIEFAMMADFENGIDGVYFLSNPSGLIPNRSNTTTLYGFTGSTNNTFRLFSVPVTQISSDYTFGFNIVTNGINHMDGMSITDFKLEALQLQTNRYHILSGTSMAAPFVSGVAAMLKANNSLCTYPKLESAIYSGAASLLSLNGKVSGRRFLKADGALTALGLLTCP